MPNKLIQMPFVFLDLNQLKAIVGGEKTWLYEQMKAAEDPLPQPVVLGPRMVRWRSDEVAAWMERRSARRDGSPAENPRQMKAKRAATARRSKSEATA